MSDYKYSGAYDFTEPTIKGWKSTNIGVYYLFENAKIVYVGSAVGDEGIKGRLSQHLNEKNFPRVNEFGYKFISNQKEVLLHEKEEIQRLKPKYNKQGK
jgi:excinuclease UvrABC nuclease subunit